MITCPFCQKPVIDASDNKSQVEDNHASNFYCPTYVDMNLNSGSIGKRLCHFSRKQLTALVGGKAGYSYQAIIPPYQIAWVTTGKVTVYKLNKEGDREGDHVYQSKRGTSYDDFLKTCHRFKILVPFS